MGSNEGSCIADIYREVYDFSLSVHDDVDTFMNTHEFAAIHDINGEKIPCVAFSRSLKSYDSRVSSSYEGIMSRGIIIYIKNEYIVNAEPGRTVRFDGRVYVIDNASSIQGEIWRIELGVYDV